MLTTVSMVSVGTETDITDQQQSREHLPQPLDCQDGWVVFNISWNPPLILSLIELEWRKYSHDSC